MFDKLGVKKKTLSSVAYDKIKEGIISGELNNEQLLSENMLAKILNMSRTPIREAIRRLETENYLKSVEGVGIMVLELSLHDLAEIYEVRIALEKAALETAIYEISERDVTQLCSEFEKIIDLYTNNTPPNKEVLYNMDSKFHNVIFSSSKNECLKEILRVLEKKIHRYQYKAYSISDTGKEATIQHLAILGKIKEKDIEQAKKLIENHINWSFEVLKNYMLKENLK